MIRKALIHTFGCALTLLLSTTQLQAQETLIFMRHGEKPTSESGQLTCKGLNRALALPDVLISRFGQPDALFSVGPKEKKPGYSIRPLSTMMPTAVRLNMPINIQYHQDEIEALEKQLLDDKYRNARIYIVWEHKYLDKMVKHLMKDLGSDQQVPKWQGSDFDTLFIVTVDDKGNGKTGKLQISSENLNKVPETCPQPLTIH
jgi:hypothetical protein